MRYHSTRLLVAACATLVLHVGTTPSYSQTAPEIARKAFASTVLLMMEDAAGQPLSLGSGFFVRGGHIATNLHVIHGASRGYAKLIGQNTKYDIEGVTAVDPRLDLVVLRLQGAKGSPLNLGDSDALQVGDNVYAVGNPQGLEGTFSQGIVSSLRQVGTEKLLQITAPISPGSSGGPVLNARAEVVGVSVATFKGGQNLNFAIPSNALKALLSTNGTPRPLSQLKQTKARPSIVSGTGDRSTNGVLCEQLTWEYTAGQSGDYAISIRNQLRENVKNVHCLLVFYDQSGTPIDVDAVRYGGVVPAGLAKRVSGKVEGSVQRLTTVRGAMRPRTKIEFRTLNFEIVN